MTDRILRLRGFYWLFLFLGTPLISQEPLPNAQPINVAGHWIISAMKENFTRKGQVPMNPAQPICESSGTLDVTR